ncbi:MAG: NADAR family protein [Clostridiales bacterium]|nr:NADAR family protein [Clostridiales bacterium]
MINRFQDEYYFLSNFYPCEMEYNGIRYQNSEAAFQAQKCANRSDRMRFSNLNASEAKKLGRSVSLRPDWEEIKVGVMREVVRAKFRCNPDLKDKLIETSGEYLEEGNTWGDRIWGTVNGNGANLLGKILMDLREELENK